VKSTYIRQIPAYALFWIFPLLICSYHPVFSLGAAHGVNIDISFLYVASILVLALNLPLLWRNSRTLLSFPTWRLAAGLVSFIWVSCIWSANPFRALVTASFFTLLFGLFSSILIHAPFLLKHERQIIRYVTYGFIFSGGVAFWQIISDALHITPGFNLLPTMYNGDVFGFARPTSLALEPQFFGSLLLVPLLYGAYHLLRNNSLSSYIIFGVSFSLLILTLSRGALFAAVIGMSVLIVSTRPRPSAILKTFVISVLSISTTTLLIACIGSVRNDSLSGYATVQSAVSQLSLGNIQLPNKPDDQSSSRIATSTESPPSTGYVKSSTDSRITMSGEAIKVWSTSTSTILFGVGIGGFGATLQASNQDVPLSSVVNNFYLELLAETGIIGMIIFISFIGVILYKGCAYKEHLLVALTIAFLIQWCFFSGVSNVVHVWFIFALLAVRQPIKSTLNNRPV
jgi:hypothetical protein